MIIKSKFVNYETKTYLLEDVPIPTMPSVLLEVSATI